MFKFGHGRERVGVVGVEDVRATGCVCSATMRALVHVKGLPGHAVVQEDVSVLLGQVGDHLVAPPLVADANVAVGLFDEVCFGETDKQDGCPEDPRVVAVSLDHRAQNERRGSIRVDFLSRACGQDDDGPS